MEQKYPEPTVGALIFNPKGKILLIKSHKGEENMSFQEGILNLERRWKCLKKRNKRRDRFGHF